MALTLEASTAEFGRKTKAKLANPSADGEREEQLRTPFEEFLGDLAELVNVTRGSVAAVGETPIKELATRPDYAITVGKALVGHVELKAPGKGADPRKFRDPHDKAQWIKLQALPNLIYTDGNEFSLWHDGRLSGTIVRLIGDVESSGSRLRAPAEILARFEEFLRWNPTPPRSAKELAHVSARLCRLLRDEVTEQLALKSPALTSLATGWRKLLFPDATDERFADGYAQAVTFGMLMARAEGIELGTGFYAVAQKLGRTSSLIGAALRLLTEDAETSDALKTSLGTLTRVLDAVQWQIISKGDPEAWLYFYEEFLAVYDNDLRKKTGSYYTPPEVVAGMVRLVDEELRGPRFGLHAGFASPEVTVADPATGTGTFVLGLLRRIAETVTADEGPGAVKAAIEAAVKRIIAFEIQLGPFAVAQLRVFAEVLELTGSVTSGSPRMFVTDTLGYPEDNEDWFAVFLAPIADSRKAANKIKRDESITVVIGNPPYKEKAKGLGGWVEGQDPKAAKSAPLAAWQPDAGWRLGAHAKHLRNLYIYFWRWATWKVFDPPEKNKTGVVCFITVAGFLAGPGFQKMREYLRQTCDAIWVIDCSPEGHQPEVATRVFQGVQQPVCIVIASRPAANDRDVAARVLFRSLRTGDRQEKFAELGLLGLDDSDWVDCPIDGPAPFLPAAVGAWAEYPKLEDIFGYNGAGVQTKLTWVVAPDADSLKRRWQALIQAPVGDKEELFHATLRDGQPADRHIRSVVAEPIPGFPPAPTPLISETGPCPPPVRYGFRSFNRQWIIPDPRVITQPNANLWQSLSERQVFLTAFGQHSPSSGPAVTVTSDVPDLHHYKGSFGGRAFPLWRDRMALEPNVRPGLLAALTKIYAMAVPADDLFVYIVAIAGHPAYTARFQPDLATPGLRIPITADAALFREVAAVGRAVVWLQTFGERMADPAGGRPAEPPRLPDGRRPRIPAEGAIPSDPASMPDSIDYDATKRRLLVGSGFVESVSPEVWRYDVSGKQVLRQWFSYRKRHRDRPLIGDRRKPSALGDIQPDHWLSEYTTELINVLNVLQMLVDLEPEQARLLDAVCAGPTLTDAQLRTAGAFDGGPSVRRTARPQPQRAGAPLAGM